MKTAGLAMVKEDPAAEAATGFRDLYDKYSRAVYLSALRVTGNPADAEDVLQTVFLRVFDRDIVLDEARSPGGYLRRAAANAAIDLLRRRNARPETELDERREGEPVHGLRLAEAPDETFSQKERLRAALARLSRENAELLILCYLEGYSYDELADLLQIERGTVGSRLHRIRSALQREMGD